MTSQSPEKYINTKVATGFLLLVLIIALSFGVNYFGVVRYIQEDNNEDPLAKRLMVLNEFIFRIQEADGAARLYSLTGKQKDKVSYQNLSDSVLITLHHIDRLFADSNFQTKTDTIKNLTAQKNELTNQLIELSEINRYRRRYGEVISIMPDSISYQISQITYSSLHVDSIENIPASTEHRNFFGRIARILTGKKDEIPPTPKTPGISQRIDSSFITRIRKDPVLERVKRQIKEINEQDARFANLLLHREQQLVDLSNKLTNTIRQIIQDLEEQTLVDSEISRQKSNNMRADLLNRLILLGISALLIILVFLVWIGRDLRKSRRLKDQLIRSREKVESLMKIKERFLANMSHEIRTPLTSIIGFSELLREKDQSAGIIHNSAIHLLALVNDILDLSKAEAGQLMLHPEPVDPNTLLNEVQQTFYRQAEQKQLNFTCLCEESIRSFAADKTRLRQILFNLTSNAIKFTDNGNVWLHLKQEKKQLLFEIGDTGCGISENRKESIFEEFTQVTEKSDHINTGTGLGLAISKKLVEAMSGKIGVENNKEKGSVFWFRIPYTEYSDEKIHRNKVHTDLSKKHIMVVDDDPLVGNLMKKFLGDKTEVTCYESAIDALEMIDGKHFDFIITDFRMPRLNGFEFIQKIRAHNPVPILVLSAGISDHDTEKLDQIKDVYRMPKPFSQDDLINKLHTVLGKYQPEIYAETKTKAHPNSLFDLSGVLDFTGDDQDFFISVTSAFIADTDKNIETLKTLIKNREYGQISEQAHKMLTGFRQFGIKDGATILKGIEVMGKKPDYNTQLRRSLRRFKKLWSRVRTSLEHEIKPKNQ